MGMKIALEHSRASLPSSNIAVRGNTVIETNRKTTFLGPWMGRRYSLDTVYLLQKEAVSWVLAKVSGNPVDLSLR